MTGCVTRMPVSRSDSWFSQFLLSHVLSDIDLTWCGQATVIGVKATE